MAIISIASIITIVSIITINTTLAAEAVEPETSAYNK